MTAAATAATVVLAAIAADAGSAGEVGEWITIAFVPGFVLSGWWLARRRPNVAVGWLFLAAALGVSIAATGAAWATAAVGRSWPGVDWGLWTFSWTWHIREVALGLAFLLFPDGRIVSRLHRGLVVFVAGVAGLTIVVTALAPGTIMTVPSKPDGAIPGVVNPIGVDALEPVVDALAGPLGFIGLLAILTPMLWTATRWRSTSGEVRRQYRWVTWIQLSMLPVPVVVATAPVGVGAALAIVYTLAAQAMIVIAILQWRAYDVDVVIRRALLATSTLVAGLAIYGAIVTGVSLVIGSSGTIASTLGAAVAIAVLVPVSTVMRRGVNRAFYGRRDDPHLVVTATASRLSAAADPSAGIDAVAATLAEQLRLPAVEVLDTTGRSVAAAGEPGDLDGHVDLPVDHHGRPLGTLRVTLRRGTDELTGAETQLLTDVAHQIGSALAAIALIDDLEQARNDAVNARDDERRRIQRDLHDGLGSSITAVTLKLDAARNHLATSGITASQDLVLAARRDLQQTLADVRRLIYSLDDRDAACTLQDAVNTDGLRLLDPAGIELEVDLTTIPTLGRPVSEQLRWIIVEAVTNIARHARATRCAIIGTVDDRAIRIEVSDDGCGINGTVPRLGRTTMAHRAASIGASVEHHDIEPSGTTVTITVPRQSPR
ncbi:MAG: histidine kinase [Acidimicrobiales bacterium]|nr:histidine kinase [Acidimicrobiales bacterium]